MFTSPRPRPAPAWTLGRTLRPTPRPDRGALIEAVQGGLGLVQAEQLLVEFARHAAALFEGVPGLSAAVLADCTWQSAPGQLAEAWRSPTGALLLARRGPTAVGVVAIRPLPGQAEIAELKRLYVRRGHRGTGIARALLSRAIGEARRLGYRQLRLETSERMPDALRLYRLAGFQPIEAYRPRAADLAPHFLSMSLDLA